MGSGVTRFKTTAAAIEVVTSIAGIGASAAAVKCSAADVRFAIDLV